MKNFKQFILTQLIKEELLTEMPWLSYNSEKPTVDLEFELRLPAEPTEKDLTNYLKSILSGDVYLTKVKEPWHKLVQNTNEQLIEYEIIPENHPNLKILYTGKANEPLKGTFILKAGTVEKPLIPLHIEQNDRERFLSSLKKNNMFKLRFLQIKDPELFTTKSIEEQNALVSDYLNSL